MSTTTPATTALPGVNVLLMGPAGTAKTYSIGTLVDTGLEVFCLFLEPGQESLFGYYRDKGKPLPANLHWHSLKAPSAGFSELLDAATKINTLSLESLAKMQDPNRAKHNRFIDLLKVLNDFTDEKDGKSYGAVDKWGPDRVLVIDGLAGIGQAAMSLVVGGKPVKSQSDWGIAQDTVEKLLRQLTENCRCHFVLIAHVEREVDQVLGGTKLMVSTLGNKLAPKLPPMFSDVILAVRTGDKFTWDTNSVMADVKTRNLPMRADNPVDFGGIITKWRARSTV